MTKNSTKLGAQMTAREIFRGHMHKTATVTGAKDEMLLRLAKQLALQGQNGAFIVPEQPAHTGYSPGSRILRAGADIRKRKFGTPKLPNESTHSSSQLVLSIDDEPTIIEWVAATLTEHGFSVIGATSVDSAITQIQRNLDLRLVITDLDMPEQDGLCVLKYLHQNLRFSHVLSAVYSGKIDKGYMLNALELGASDFIAKPTPSEVFLKRITDIFARRQLKIILCTPDAISRSLIEKMLKGAGYEVSCTDNGAGVVKLLSSTKRHLIVTEFLLNDMTGLDLLQKASEQAVPPPFVFLEEPRLKLTADSIRAVGGHGLISKPFRSVEILQLIGSLERYVKTASIAVGASCVALCETIDEIAVSVMFV
jgi:CheY-like chemotaxis protein